MIKQMIAAASAFGLAACTTAGQGQPTVPAASRTNDVVQVMVLGTYHFSNPGLDVVNMASDDVLADNRQAELRLLADRLAEFQPTAVAVERVRTGEDFIDPGYASFTEGDLSTQRNEIVQIGYRVAYMLGIDRVYSVDEQDGEIAFFPFDTVQSYAEETGQSEYIDELIATLQEDAGGMMKDMEKTSLLELLARHNDVELTNRMHSEFYYALMKLADADTHPGAALNYGWYARNALIFSNIAANTRQGDRVLVIYGAGHNYWLRHFVEATPGFQLVDPLPYLGVQATASAITNGS
jgi:hypothetical protein